MLAFSVTIKLYDPVIITIMMTSDHIVYINDKTSGHMSSQLTDLIDESCQAASLQLVSQSN